MFPYLLAMLLVFVFSSCASAPAGQNRDAQADSELGADQNEQIFEAQQTINSIQERNRQEQKNALQRQITDPNH